MTDKSDNRVGHLNTILARRGGNLNDPIFKSSNARAMLKFRKKVRNGMEDGMVWIEN